MILYRAPLDIADDEPAETPAHRRTRTRNELIKFIDDSPFRSLLLSSVDELEVFIKGDDG